MKTIIVLLLLSLLGFVNSATSPPTGEPSGLPSAEPSAEPSGFPSAEPSALPSGRPNGEPTNRPTGEPSNIPTGKPTGEPSAIPSSRPTGEPTSIPTSIPTQNYFIRYGDKFGDGWNGVELCVLRDYEDRTKLKDNSWFNDVEDEFRFSPAVGDRGTEIASSCIADEVVRIAFCSNGTLLTSTTPPIQSWELYFQVEKNGNILHGCWNTHLVFKCSNRNNTRNDLILASTTNLCEPLDICPQCDHPKPKPKPKPADSKELSVKSHDDDDKKGPKKKDDDKIKPPPLKYWPVPIKLMNLEEQNGWFKNGSLVYAEYTISDASRMNLLAEGTLCIDHNGPRGGREEVCEVMLPDGHYIFRASGNLDYDSGNYTWQLCGKEAVKYEVNRTEAIAGKNASIIYDYRASTGFVGSEVSFVIKKGKCIVDENVITVADYKNASTSGLDTVVTLEGHFLLENVHWNTLSAEQSKLLEKDINEFLSFQVNKIVTISSVVDMESGTLIGYRVVGTHAESALMSGLLDDLIEEAVDGLEYRMNSGTFLSTMKSYLQSDGMTNDIFLGVQSVTFVDLEVTSMVTLRNGKTASGDIIAGTDHGIVSQPDVVLSSQQENILKESFNYMTLATASGAFAVLAVAVLLVINVFKPHASSVSADIDSSTANLVSPQSEHSFSSSVSKEDSISTYTSSNARDSLITSRSRSFSNPSYEDSLSKALSQRWQLNSDEDSVRL